MTDSTLFKQILLSLITALFIFSDLAAQDVVNGNNSPGYSNRTGIDMVAGSNFTTPRFYMVNGYRFHPQFATGIGVGITPYNNPLILMPLYFDAQIALIDRRVRPVIQISAGRNISINTSDDPSISGHRGGRFFSPAAGIEFTGENRAGVTVTAGYSFDSAQYRRSGFGPQTFETDLTYRRVVFGVALLF
ncbi:MAG: hypothetical protein JJU46_02490 [Balneolaceae bacterium]|nr:hypothetical protein [Balneolaceae bacterium]MCH8548938.1 hypothetical protein [Balneolaceae bacterium]